VIDFVKLDISYLPYEVIKGLDLLEFKSQVNLHTGEVGWPEEAEFNELVFACYKKKSYLSGSLHKFLNSIEGRGAQNYDDFSLSMLSRSVQYLEDKFGIDPSKTKIVRLEFGINIASEKCPTLFIDENVISHRKIKTPNIDSDYNKKGRYIQHKMSQCYVKIYDKGRQYGELKNILRIEVGTKKAQYTQKLGLFTLSDIWKKDKLLTLGIELLKRFDKFLIVDHFDEQALPQYWLHLKNTQCPSTYLRRWKAFIFKKQSEGQFTLRKSIRKQIEDIWHQLVMN